MADSTSQNRRSRPPSFGSVMSASDVDRDTPLAYWKASVRDGAYSEHSMALDEYDEDLPSPASSRAPRISPRIRAAAASRKQQIPPEAGLEGAAPSPSTTGGGGGNGSAPSPAKRIRRKITEIQLDALDKVFAQDPSPDMSKRVELGKAIDMDTKAVTAWFQNRRTAVKRAQAKLKSRSSLPASGTGTGTSASPSTSTTATVPFPRDERHLAVAADVDELADDNDDEGPAPSAKDSRAGSAVPAAPIDSRVGGSGATESMSVAALLEATASASPSSARPPPPQRTNSSGPPAPSSGAATPAPVQPSSRPSTPSWAPANSHPPHAHAPRQPLHPPPPHSHTQPTPYWQMYPPPHMSMGMGMPPPMLPHPGMMHPAAAMYYGRPTYPPYPPSLAGGGGKKAAGGHANANVELLRRQSAPSLAQAANGNGNTTVNGNGTANGTGTGSGPAWSRTPSLVSSSSTLSTSTSGSGASLSPPSPSVVSDTLSTSTVTGSNTATRTKARTRPGTNALTVSTGPGGNVRGGSFGRSVSLGSGTVMRGSGGGARKHAKLWEHLPSSPPDDRPRGRRGSHSPPSSDSSDSPSDSDSDDDEGRAGKLTSDGKDTARRRSTGPSPAAESELALERAFVARAGPRTLEWACARDRVRGVRREDVGSESESDGEGRVGEKRRRTSMGVVPAATSQRQQVPQVHVTAPTNGAGIGTGGAIAPTVWDPMPGGAGGSGSSRTATSQPSPPPPPPPPARTEMKQEERSPEMQEMALLLVDLRRKR